MPCNRGAREGSSVARPFARHRVGHQAQFFRGQVFGLLVCKGIGRIGRGALRRLLLLLVALGGLLLLLLVSKFPGFSSLLAYA